MCPFQWEVGVTEMEELQRSEAVVEGQDPSEQRHLEGLVHAV